MLSFWDFDSLNPGGFDPYTIYGYTLDTTMDSIHCSGVYIDEPSPTRFLMSFVELDPTFRLFFAKVGIPAVATIYADKREITLSNTVSYFLPRVSIFNVDAAFIVGAASSYGSFAYGREAGFIHSFPNNGETCIDHGVW